MQAADLLWHLLLALAAVVITGRVLGRLFRFIGQPPVIGEVVAGTDAAHAGLVPVSDALDGKIELAFDHARIVRDAVERVRVDLELRGIATAFVGSTFTLAELRAVYEAVWGVHLDGANFRRSILAEEGWVIPTGRRARPGATGGKPAELYRAGQMWQQGGGPIRFPQSSEKRRGKR